jgi:hypothetical protein
VFFKVLVTEENFKYKGPQTISPLSILILSSQLDLGSHNLTQHLRFSDYLFTSMPAICPAHPNPVNMSPQKFIKVGLQIWKFLLCKPLLAPVIRCQFTPPRLSLKHAGRLRSTKTAENHEFCTLSNLVHGSFTLTLLNPMS